MIPGKTKAERWKYALSHPKELKNEMMNITPEQQMTSKLVMLRGNMIGLAIAWVFLWIKGLWFFSVSMFFIVGLQLVTYIGARQQYLTMQEAKKEAENSEIFQKLMEEK